MGGKHLASSHSTDMQKLTSRKLWAAIMGVLLNVLNATLELGIDEDTLGRINLLLVGYLAAQGLVDAVAVKNKSEEV